jgi:hypothetical protein
MKRVLSLLALAVLLPGCGMMTEYRGLRAVVQEGVATAIDDRKSFNDTKASVLFELPCDASIGAIMRLGDSRKRALLIELCGGPPADSQVTVDDLAAMLSVLRAQP